MAGTLGAQVHWVFGEIRSSCTSGVHAGRIVVRMAPQVGLSVLWTLGQSKARERDLRWHRGVHELVREGG